MKISLIIPCHNVDPYIDRTLSSLSSQTIGVENLEIICVDDASTDNIWEHLLAWEQKYPENILLVQCEENGRQGRARNIGLSHATDEWIAFIDSDDWVEPDYFEKLIREIGRKHSLQLYTNDSAYVFYHSRVNLNILR